MAEKVSSVLEGWTKWQIAVAVGAPVALGLAGLWYYRRGKSPTQPVVEDNADKKDIKPDQVSIKICQQITCFILTAVIISKNNPA